MAKKTNKNSSQKNVVEEVKLDAIMMDEQPKKAPRTPLYKEEDGDEDNWQDVPKKHAASYDDDGDEGVEEEEKEVFEEIEEDEVFFREKGPKSQ